jgi:GR25 family glycosyltransferase involved in LPS biosynthesis
MYKTYVMHYTPLKDRREFISQQLLLKGISDAEFITEFDREDLTEQDLYRYNKDKDLHKEVSEISRRPHGFAGSVQYNYEQMSLASVSLNLKHLEGFRRFLDQDLNFALFLEDDCRFISSTKIETIIEQAPENWDVIFLGGAFNHGIITPISVVGGSYILAQHPSTNTTSSIIYNKNSVRKILPYMESFCVSIDWQLNYAFYKANLNVYHTYPYLCTQGDFRSTAKDE